MGHDDDSEEYDSNDTGSSEEEDESGSDASNEEESDEEDSEKLDTKHNVVENDLIEIRRMIEEMDKIKMRLQFRLTQERENRMSIATCPARRRSSVKDIIVPSTSISTSVQTVWDMSPMYVTEKVIDHSTDDERRKVVTPAFGELSLEDLVRSAGIVPSLKTQKTSEDGVKIPEVAKSMTVPTSPISSQCSSAIPTEELRTPSVETGHTWNQSMDQVPSQGIVTTNNDLNQSVHSAPSVASLSSLNPARLSILDEFDSIHRAYSPPSSPINQSTMRRESASKSQQKTVAQKEMEAIQSLLF